MRLVVDSEIGGEYVDYSKKPPVQPAQHAYRLGFESVRLAIPLSPAKAQDCLGLDVNGSCIGLQAPGYYYGCYPYYYHGHRYYPRYRYYGYPAYGYPYYWWP